jgi:hypothetical protein
VDSLIVLHFSFSLGLLALIHVPFSELHVLTISNSRVELRIVMHYLSISRLGIYRPRQPGHHTIQVDGISLFAGYDFCESCTRCGKSVDAGLIGDFCSRCDKTRAKRIK